MPLYENGPVRLHYVDEGSGFPLLILPGGGLNATLGNFKQVAFDPLETFSGDYRCIAMDLRNANGGQSSGPVDVERNWDSYADDQLALLDHLGVEKCLVMGFCIGGPFIWNLLKRAPDRFVAATLVHPSGFRPEMPDLFFENNMNAWGPALAERRDDVDMATIEAFLDKMYRNRGDFLFTVDRDFVRNCQTPVLILPDDIPAHPYAVAMESALLAPNAQVSLYPWKEDPDRARLAVRHIQTFLKANRPD